MFKWAQAFKIAMEIGSALYQIYKEEKVNIADIFQEGMKVWDDVKDLQIDDAERITQFRQRVFDYIPTAVSKAWRIVDLVHGYVSILKLRG